MDLSKFSGRTARLEQPIDVVISDPDSGEATDMVIRVIAYQSEKVRKHVRDVANREIRARERNPRRYAFTVEKQQEMTIETFVAAVVDWEGVVMDGEELPCTPDNVRRIAANPDFAWIVRQVDEAADDEALFMRA